MGFQAQIGHAAQNALERYLAFDARYCGAKAEMTRPGERQVPVILAADIEAIGIREPLWITVRRSHHRNDRLALLDSFPTQHHVFGSQACGLLARALVAQQFLHRRWNQ